MFARAAEPPSSRTDSFPAKQPGREFRWLAVACVALPLLALLGHGLSSWAAIWAEATGRAARSADVLREHALRTLETHDAMLLGVEQAMQGMGWEEVAASARLHDHIRVLAGASSSATGIGLVGPDGRMVLYSSAFPSPPVDVSDREYYRVHREMTREQASGRAHVGPVVVSRPRDTPVFSFSRPLWHPGTSRFDGLLVTGFSPGFFSAFYGSVAPGQGDSASLLRADGLLLARWPEPQRWDGRLADAGLEGMADRLFTEAAVARSGLDGRERLYALRRVGSYPLVVAFGVDPGPLRLVWLRGLLWPALGAAAASSLLLALLRFARIRTERERGALGRARQEAERRAQAEAALREAERLALIGQLSAGIAHDVKNLSAVMASGAALIARHADEPAQVRDLAGRIVEAAGRGTEMAVRLLNLACREGAAPGAREAAVADPQSAIATACALLRPALGARHPLLVMAGAMPPLVRGSQGELEAALVNLVVNARDALPEGGEIRVAAMTESGPGMRCLCLSVSDGGSGMPPEVLARASEPFFTTKARGRGTGLGLASVRAFAEGAGGAFRITSAPGRGTTVTLWLPEATC